MNMFLIVKLESDYVSLYDFIDDDLLNQCKDSDILIFKIENNNVLQLSFIDDDNYEYLNVDKIHLKSLTNFNLNIIEKL